MHHPEDPDSKWLRLSGPPSPGYCVPGRRLRRAPSTDPAPRRRPRRRRRPTRPDWTRWDAAAGTAARRPCSRRGARPSRRRCPPWGVAGG